MKYQFLPANQFRAQAISILSDNNLPVSDLDENKLLYVLLDDNNVIGTGGLEVFEDIGLLRSISIKKGLHGKGLGKILTDKMEKEALSQGVTTLYLLTTTANDFFERHGYTVISRENVPESIKSSSEFSSICPSTAIVMKKELEVKKKILFVCVENSNRSQMSEAFAKTLGGNRVEAYSAGSKPSGKINPKAIAAMQEAGYDLQSHQSKSLGEVEQYAPFDAVVTMGCGDACPWMPAKKFIDWEIPDPRNMDTADFNKVRDLIRDKVRDLLTSL